MRVLFIGKRFYTNRDALREKYGRIWQLPWHWSRFGIATTLWLVDYHTREVVHATDGALHVDSTPVKNLAVLHHWLFGRLVEANCPDVVVASGDCYIGWLGLRAAKRLGARFVFDVYDKYDEFAGYHSPPGFDLFRYLLTKASARLFASRGLMEALGNSETDVLVPNGVDTARFAPRDMGVSRRAMGLPANGLLVGYFGGMECDRGVADLIDAISKLRAQGLAVQLVLGGKAPATLDVRRPGVVYLGDVAYDRMPEALGACDLLAVPYRRSAFMDAGASNKIAEAIACGRSIVATRTPNLLANFPKQAAQLDPLLAEPANPDSLARSIRLQAERRVQVAMPSRMSWGEISMDVAERLELPGTAHTQATSRTS